MYVGQYYFKIFEITAKVQKYVKLEVRGKRKKGIYPTPNKLLL